MPAERRKARQLRAQGMTITEISAAIGVSKGTISPWIRDVAAPRVITDERKERYRQARLAAGRSTHDRAVARSEAYSTSAQRLVGELNDRELLLVGVALYWAEGSKEKPWRRGARVILINSDVSVIRVFLRWLDLLGVPEADRCYRLSIHESADVASQEQWWNDQLDLGGVEFQRVTI